MQLNFFNTIHLSGPELSEAKKSNGMQDERVLEIFRYGQLMTPFDCWEWYCKNFPPCPLTSIRRSITCLTNQGKLIKTQEMVKEKYGKRNHYWKINAERFL